MKKVNLIVAYDENKAIGNKGKIPWHISDDLKRFKALTVGHTVVMGKNTWESLPKKPLPDRKNVIISTSLYVPSYFSVSFQDYGDQGLEQYCKDTLVAKNLAAIERLSGQVFIIGGSRLYQEALDKNLVKTVYLTEVDGVHEADTYFTSNLDNFKIIEEDKREGFTFKKLICEF